jgi:hypothetical protein
LERDHAQEEVEKKKALATATSDYEQLKAKLLNKGQRSEDEKIDKLNEEAAKMQQLEVIPVHIFSFVGYVWYSRKLGDQVKNYDT